MSFSQAPADFVATDLLRARLGLDIEESLLTIGDDTPGDAYMNSVKWSPESRQKSPKFKLFT
jgi:hypothetical protein